MSDPAFALRAAMGYPASLRPGLETEELHGGRAGELPGASVEGLDRASTRDVSPAAPSLRTFFTRGTVFSARCVATSSTCSVSAVPATTTLPPPTQASVVSSRPSLHG